jgi:hypothetical protein
MRFAHGLHYRLVVFHQFAQHVERRRHLRVIVGQSRSRPIWPSDAAAAVQIAR